MTDRLDTSRAKLRNFGLTFAAVGLVFMAIFLWRGNPAWPWPLAGGILFLLLGLIAPSLLRPVYVAWMKFAFVLAWINTRIILGLFFFLVLTPIGLAMRLAGKDILDQRIDRSAKSYWAKRPRVKLEQSRYERLF